MSVKLQPVCVVIPCYRIPLALFEAAALERCLAVLKRHPIVVAKPNSLDITGLLCKYPQLKQESFPDECFRGVAGYNRMMLSDEFYARFAEYEYVLVYQLDAFVFSDQLLSWCERGYDYIGAPWLPRDQPPSIRELVYSRLRSILYRLIDRKDDEGIGAHHGQYDYCAGNGGFSLRRVARMREVLRKLPRRLERYRWLSHYTYNEDIFFCVEANRFLRRVRTPGLKEAVKFAWESHPRMAAELNRQAMPFGCHGWNRLHRDDWRPIFESLGYSIDELLEPKDPSAQTVAQAS